MKSFWYAIKGIGRMFFERSFVIEVVCGALVIISMFVYRYSSIEKAILFIMIFAVLGAEGMNSAIEKTVDLASPGRQKLAGQAKDMAAGAVLLLAVCAIIIAIIIILPKIVNGSFV